ncbi:hypothetical protein YC2023_038829 [Brassica napus]
MSWRRKRISRFIVQLEGDCDGDGEALISKSISSNRKATLRLLSFTGVGDRYYLRWRGRSFRRRLIPRSFSKAQSTSVRFRSKTTRSNPPQNH